jgi:hypothetical protein
MSHVEEIMDVQLIVEISCICLFAKDILLRHDDKI